MDNKVRTPIIWFGIFMALMLFQTSYMRLGTVTALVTLMLAIFTAFSSGGVSFKLFYLPRESKILILFLTFTLFSTLFSGSFPSYILRYIAQILLCIVLLAMYSLEKPEENFLRFVFTVSTVIYALLTIWSCYQLGTTRYYHDSIVLFNTKLDPNFIGIPFVSASVLILDNILEGKKRLINLVCYVILTIAIVYTASRGNMLSLLISNILVLSVYLQKNKVSIVTKIIWVMLIVVAVVYLSKYLASNYTLQWERMTVFGEENDNGRIELWNRAFNAWRQSPVLGKGLGAMTRIYGKASHNTYIQLLSETGVIGFMLFSMFSMRLLAKTFRVNKTYFCILTGCLLQIMFLDAIDNRCLWVILCWLSSMPEQREWDYYEV